MPTKTHNREGKLNIVCQLPAVERARRYLATLPVAVSGEGGHNAAFHAACALVHGFGFSEDTAFALLSEWNTGCRPPWSPAEIAHKIRSAIGAGSDKPKGYLLGEALNAPAPLPGTNPKWPDANATKIREIAAAGPTATQLAARSPHPLNVNEDGSDCAGILQSLFADAANSDPLLCVGKSNSEFAARPLSAWLSSGKLPGLSLVVPSPMCARIGRTKDGRESEHTLENTGPRRFLVVEFDTGSANDHAARLWHLAEYGAPLALVVHSGGKSLHGWFYCQGQPEASLRRFMRYAVSIGADRATWTRSQFVRLPAGQRDTGTRQSVFYFNPAAIANASNPDTTTQEAATHEQPKKEHAAAIGL